MAAALKEENPGIASLMEGEIPYNSEMPATLKEARMYENSGRQPKGRRRMLESHHLKKYKDILRAHRKSVD